MPRNESVFRRVWYSSWWLCVSNACISGRPCQEIRSKCKNKPKYLWESFSSACSSCSARMYMISAQKNIELEKYEEAITDLDKAKEIAKEQDNNNQLLEISSTKLNIYMNYLKDRKKAREELENIKDYTKRLEAELRASDPR